MPEADFVYDQAVILTIDLISLTNYGTKAQQLQIAELEVQLAEILPARSGLDGDEFGDGECIIYIYGPSADKIYQQIEPILKRSSFDKIDITLQYGSAENPNLDEKNFTL